MSILSAHLLRSRVVLIDFARNSNCSKIFRFIIEAEVLNEVVVVFRRICKVIKRCIGLEVEVVLLDS